jgi:hypothetical protein
VEDSDCLQGVVPPSQVNDHGAREYVSTLRPRHPYFLPVKAGLTVTLHHERWEPFSLTLPVVVWPRFWTQLTLAFVIPTTAAVQRIAGRLLKDGTTVFGVFQEELRSPFFWGQLVLFGVLALVFVRIVAWIFAGIGGPSD